MKGLVFILGLHADQLSHSVRGAYGASFNGSSYLRRFFNRQYALAQPSLEPLVLKLAFDMGLENAPFEYPGLVRFNYTAEDPPASRFIARYMEAYGLSARDAFEVMGILQTSHALVRGQPLHLAYLLPLIFGQMQGLPAGALPPLDNPERWLLHIIKDRFGNEYDELDFAVVAKHFSDASKLDRDQLAKQYQGQSMFYPIRAVYNTHSRSTTDMTSVANYPKLLATVGRFQIPDQKS